MKSLLLLGVCVLAMPVMAQKVQDCALTPRQTLVAEARGPEKIKEFIDKGVVFDEQVRCGGSIVQLAIRRGNAEVLDAILRQDPKRANAIVDLNAFPIPGAPKTIPIVLFAAYSAPNENIMKVILAHKGSITATDDMGSNILWYMDRNPVLRKTALQEELGNQLLYGMAAPQNTQQDPLAAVANQGGQQAPQPGQATPQDMQAGAQQSAPGLVKEE